MAGKKIVFQLMLVPYKIVIYKKEVSPETCPEDIFKLLQDLHA